MLNIPEEIKDLFRSDNNRLETHKKFKLTFYDDEVDTLYPYETLFPEESLFPSEHGEPWLVIENDKIVSESLQITESLSSGEDIVFGSCEGAEMQITVADIIEDLTNKEFTLTIEIGGYELALGIYTVKSFERQSDRRKRKITAYDRMEWFNVDVSDWYNNLSFPLTLKSFRDSLCEYIGIQQAQVNLVFDSMELTKTIEPEQISGLDVLTAICEINGCFGHIDKTGQLVYVQLQQTGLYPSETLYPEEDLYPSEFGGDSMPTETISTYKQPMIYEDYMVEGISGLTIRQEEGDVGASVGNGDNVYAIEGNFLVYGKSASDLLNIANSLLPYISGRTYRPASLDCNCMPWLEVGDALIIPTKNDVVETFLMKRTISGCQNMRDKIESTGSQKREEQFTIQRQITQLEGKSAVIVKSVEEVSVRVTDLKNYTESQFQVTAEQISAEVTRATAAEEELSGRITVNADAITLEVQQRKDGETQLSSQITQTATQIRSEVKNTTDNLQSQITQQAGQINLKVSKGDVSSQLSVETGQVTISSNRLVVNSTNFKLDSNGNATFSGNITGGTINIGNGIFQVNSSGKVTAKNIDIDGVANQNTIGCDVFSANTASVTTLQDCATAYIDSLNATDIWCGGDINCDYINCRAIYSSMADEEWSDRRLKDNITDISFETAKCIIENLKPVSFDIILDKQNQHPGMGFIAQDVVEICNKYNIKLPLYGKHNDYYTIPYTNYVPILVSVVQELILQINEIKGGRNENNNI